LSVESPATVLLVRGGTAAFGGRRIAVTLLLLSAVLLALAARPPASHADVVWLCKPEEQPNPCHESLETTVESSDGSSRVENPPLPADSPIDCFYVYPTVSGQPTTNANKDKDEELIEIARYQASRYSQRCRVYAPVYRQLTLLSINAATAEQRAEGGKLAYGDVREAWRDYLAKYNHGRGFVLLGHSQGTRMLRQLIREEVDPKPEVRRHLINGILLGGNVLVRKGQKVGGDFRNIPACTAANQTRCMIAWSTFNAPPPDNSRFGRSPATDTSGAGFPAGPNYEVLCTNPASLGANERKPLTSLTRTEPFPGTIGALLVVMYGGPPPSAPTPWVEPGERYTGRCETSAGANVLMLQSIGNARKLNPSPDATWGLHLADANIALGELIDVVGRAADRYLLGRTPRPRILGRGLRVSRKRRVRPLIECRADPDVVCAGRVRLRSRGRRVVGFGSKSYSVHGGSRKRFSLRVPGRALRLLRSKGAIRVRAELLQRGSGKRLQRVLVRVRPPRRRP
jgi:DUF3089 family protein